LLNVAAWAQQGPSFKSVSGAEKGVLKHDLALARLAAGLEDWLTGRSDLAAIKATLAAVKSDLGQATTLPKDVAARSSKAEQGLLAAVAGFTAEQSPDSEGQRALFESLNGYTRDRSVALLEWRISNNRQLRSAAQKGAAQARYLDWEAAWLPLWKAEVDITYRLQKSVLHSSKAEKDNGPAFVRELLALQGKANAVPVPKELAALQEVAVRRLTLLARTAEQLNRLGRGESRGALTRVRRLNKEQTELGRQLQDQRLDILVGLAK
jgi:hypothetical protein